MTLVSFNSPEITIPAMFLIVISGLLLVTSRSIRWLPLVLGLQYVGVFMFVFLTWSVGLALVKLAAGWMAALLLGVGQMNTSNIWDEEDQATPSSSVFRLLVAILAGLSILALSPRIQNWFPNTGYEELIGSLFLVSMGLVHIGLSPHPIRTVIGLLTLLAGFEILYANLENSILVAGLLAGLTIGIALVGVYLAISPTVEEFW